MTEAARPILRGEARIEPAPRHDRAGQAAAGGARAGVRRRRAAAVGAEGQAPGTGRGGAGARLCHLHRPHPDRDGRDAARRRWTQMARDQRGRREEAGKLRRDLPGGDHRRNRSRRTRRGASWPGPRPARSFDRLEAAQSALARGADGTAKPLSCSTSALRRIAETRPRSLSDLGRILDAPRLDRFGAAFLEALAAD